MFNILVFRNICQQPLSVSHVYVDVIICLFTCSQLPSQGSSSLAVPSSVPGSECVQSPPYPVTWQAWVMWVWIVFSAPWTPSRCDTCQLQVLLILLLLEENRINRDVIGYCKNPTLWAQSANVLQVQKLASGKPTSINVSLVFIALVCSLGHSLWLPVYLRVF